MYLASGCKLLPFFLDLEGLAVQMADLYCKNLPLSKDLDVQESMYGEELLSMACNVLVQVNYYAAEVLRSFSVFLYVF